LLGGGELRLAARLGLGELAAAALLRRGRLALALVAGGGQRRLRLRARPVDLGAQLRLLLGRGLLVRLLERAQVVAVLLAQRRLGGGALRLELLALLVEGRLLLPRGGLALVAAGGPLDLELAVDPVELGARGGQHHLGALLLIRQRGVLGAELLQLLAAPEQRLLQLEVLAVELGADPLELPGRLLVGQDLPVAGVDRLLEVEDLLLLAVDHLAQVEELALAGEAARAAGAAPARLLELAAEAGDLLLEFADPLGAAAVRLRLL